MGDFLHPYKKLDVLGWYKKITPYLKDFLKDKEIAAKIIGPNFVLLKRGTKLSPLYITDLANISDDYLQIRAKNHLKDVKKKLTEKEILIWQYFFPRKLVNFFYACNKEYGKEIERIFIDIDRQTNSAEDARKVALATINTINSDKQFQKLVQYRQVILRTGSSFHIYLLLKKPVDHYFYDTYLSYGKGKEHMFISQRAEKVSKITGLNILAGHERKKDAIILDTSNTPPGKLARAPFSLHIKNANTIDGITVPVSEKQLEDPQLITKLQKLTPETIWNEKEKYLGLLN